MKTLIKNATQIITVNTNGRHYKRGKDHSNISILDNHSILVEDGLIKDFIPTNSKVSVEKIIDAKDCIVLPGLVECHTHAAFSGSRANEFVKRLNGSTYEEITSYGGGIVSTMKSVRNSSFEDLVKLLKPRINNFIAQGITTLEIKSGYGLSFYDEIKLLQVINHFKNFSLIEIIPTFLGAHTYPPEFKNDHKGYLNMIINEMLPYIIENNLAEQLDAFCEKSAFSYEEVDKIFSKAKELGYKLRLHTEQFSNIGGLEIAMKHNVLSVDHLEVITNEQISLLSKSNTVAVVLPGASFFLNEPFAPARELIDKNAILAISTDFNPGSSNIQNLQLIMQIAALKMNLSIEEIISAVTINAAKAIGLSDRIGSIEINKQADFAIFEASEIADIIYNIGINLNKFTLKKGEVVFQRN